MVDSAAAVPACARAVDAERRGTKGHSASGTDPFVPWRSGATERVQAGAEGGESAIGPRAAKVTVTVEVTVAGTRQVWRLRDPTRTRLPALLVLKTEVRIVPQKRSGPKVP